MFLQFATTQNNGFFAPLLTTYITKLPNMLTEIEEVIDFF